MKTTDLATLRLEAKQRCDQDNTSFVSDAEWNRMINRSADALRRLLVNEFGEDYYTTFQDFSTVNDQVEYDLPMDFYKLRGIDAEISPGQSNFDRISRTLYRFDWKDRNIYNNIYTTYLNDERYRIVGSVVRFTSPLKATNFRLWYQPVHIDLATDTATIDGIAGFDEYIVVDAARKAAIKEESFEQATFLATELAQIWQFIKVQATGRDADMPFRIQRVRKRKDYYYNNTYNE